MIDEDLKINLDADRRRLVRLEMELSSAAEAVRYLYDYDGLVPNMIFDGFTVVEHVSGLIEDWHDDWSVDFDYTDEIDAIY